MGRVDDAGCSIGVDIWEGVADADDCKIGASEATVVLGVVSVTEVNPREEKKEFKPSYKREEEVDADFKSCFSDDPQDHSILYLFRCNSINCWHTAQFI